MQKDYFDIAVQSFFTSYVVHDPDNEIDDRFGNLTWLPKGVDVLPYVP